MSRRRLGSYIGVLLIGGVLLAAAFNIQRIQDVALYHQYEPNASVATFVSDAGMSERGKFLFYVSHPALLEAQEFNERCHKHEKTTAILGCYDGQRIYVFDVKDERLNGIRPTTAAHEMLHAAYRRLSEQERVAVDALLEAEYSKLQEDTELVERMAFYARTQPGERGNELHSIIGTEVRTMSAELESYYTTYFTDRSKVVDQHERYRLVFDELKKQADALDRRIVEVSEAAESKKATYSAQSTALQSDIASFNARAEAGAFENQAAFSRERQSLVARSSALEALRIEINNTINEYNALVIEFNAVALETDTLNRSLDSQLEPAPSI